MGKVVDMPRIHLLLLLSALTSALDNGIGLTPPLGWRSYNAFGGGPTQAIMEKTMEMMVDRSRTVNGEPTSLLDLGYNRVGLDGGWNYCFAENHTFHWESDGRPVWNSAFPNPQGMVDKAHQAGLKPGWYLNNCGCAENHFDEAMVDKVMRGSVQMLVDQGWDGVKFDSCSMFYNQTRWAALINQTSTKPVLIENCHQGAYSPGEQQWQGYTKNSTTGGYDHYLGMFFGLDRASELNNVSFKDCEANCTNAGKSCAGFTFVADVAQPQSLLSTCYVSQSARRNHMDMSNINHCTGDQSPSDCPFNMYRVSGDISGSWRAMLTNLEYTLPFLGQGGVHPPFPQDSTVRSRPGGWAYPDMLEVGNLANATEDRSHFGAWAIMSSPLILSFNMNDTARMDRVWPIITNTAVIGVNQRWVGSPGRRVVLDSSGLQVWAKPLGTNTYAVFLMNAASDLIQPSLPMQNVSTVFKDGVCIRDLYTGKLLPPLKSGAPLVVSLPAHDSAMFCAWPGVDNETCSESVGAQDCP